MAAKPGFFDYIKAAFNARPLGMFVAPNWIGLGAFGLLGMMEPGFWVLGAGLELGYLLRSRPTSASSALVAAARCRGHRRLEQAHPQASSAASIRRSPHLRSPRRSAAARSSISRHTAARDVPGGLEAQADSLGRLSWMFLRLLVARRTIQQVIGESGDGDGPAQAARALERQQARRVPTEELRRSLGGQIDILKSAASTSAPTPRTQARVHRRGARTHPAAGRADPRAGRALDRSRSSSRSASTKSRRRSAPRASGSAISRRSTARWKIC